MKLHISDSKFTPVVMRDEDTVMHKALQLRGLGMRQYDISTFLNINPIQVKQWLENEL